ncbi:PHP domain-containing protein [Verticiella sediminum]|uniref:PHP domain-containing protein n=1 Tax=Verticiella sediminum TaxID=1247510 RepID=A0A556AYG1_9BURK|nr:3',5'-nucleoside bisphosphate phosphatase [Verticiella sediminum]TSH97983.1 PHP domain-containing protein [Verticiella sediminum]
MGRRLEKVLKNYDLHCHSTVSDGELPPRAVVARALEHGVDVLALTDHDEVAGAAEAAQAARALGLAFVPGVEISVTWAGKTIHVVGLRVDPDDAALVQGLALTRDGRLDRAREMGARLAALGIEGAFEGAMARAGNPALVSRTHFARYLLDVGHCRDMNAAFDRYLGTGKPAYVDMQWARLSDALAWIAGAGGQAVLAHPGRYDYSPTAFGALFAEFKERGGAAIEVVTGSHSPDQYGEYADIARRYGFLASRGSDFHAPGYGRVDLGELPPLPAGLTPVWHDWGLG